MNFILYFNCKKLNPNDTDAIGEYAKRLSAYCKTNWYCKPTLHPEHLCPDRMNAAHTRMFQIQTGTASLSSEELAAHINQIGIRGASTVYFFIGYCWQNSGIQPPPVLMLSSMEISQGLTGVMLYEQLYRSYRILNHQPYHK